MPRAPRLVIPQHWPVQDAARYRPLEWFVPYERNARTHPESQIALLASLLTKFGPDQDIVVDEDRVILKGHGRILAAQQAGLTCFTFTQRIGLSESDKQAMRLADNQVALLSGWDKELVQGEIGSLKTQGYDILQLGFPEAQLRGWGIQVGTEAPPEEVIPEPPRVPIVRPGDLWVLGKHRLICGDCTDADAVQKVLGGKRPRLMVTDPPYGVNYNPGWREEMGIDWMGQVQRSSTHPNVRRLTSRALGLVRNDDTASWQGAWDLFPGDVAYIWCASLTNDTVIADLERSGLKRRTQIVWRKQHFVFGRGDYHWQHELCWHVVRQGKKSGWTGDRRQTTVWDIANASAFHGESDDVVTGHGTQKPVECMKRPMENNSSAGDYVYEPFSGSGTTIIAGEMTDRRVLAIELDPGYVQVAIERWQQFANQEATLDGVPFEQVAASRRKGRAKGHSRKQTPGPDARRGGVQPVVRTPRHARRPAPGGVAAGEPPIVAGDT